MERSNSPTVQNDSSIIYTFQIFCWMVIYFHVRCIVLFTKHKEKDSRIGVKALPTPFEFGESSVTNRLWALLIHERIRLKDLTE